MSKQIKLKDIWNTIIYYSIIIRSRHFKIIYLIIMKYYKAKFINSFKYYYINILF